MIKAIIFDLDGTLIQTEVLKANSYAQAINELTQGEVAQKEVMTIFNAFVGLSREEVVQGLSSKFKPTLARYFPNLTDNGIQEALIATRLRIYREILSDNRLLARHFCTYTLGLFHELHKDGFPLVLATMSHLPEAKKVTEAMEIYNLFHAVFTRDDVQNGKPSPDIYEKARGHLQLRPGECLVIEDSVNGILAAQRAKMPVFAVTNSITRASVHQGALLPQKFVVDDLRDLKERVRSFIANPGAY